MTSFFCFRFSLLSSFTNFLRNFFSSGVSPFLIRFTSNLLYSSLFNSSLSSFFNSSPSSPAGFLLGFRFLHIYIVSYLFFSSVILFGILSVYVYVLAIVSTSHSSFFIYIYKYMGKYSSSPIIQNLVNTIILFTSLLFQFQDFLYI